MQRSYIEAIWKVLQGDTNQWPLWLGYALWADRMTVKKNTGYSPYYLLYGQHPLLPFDVIDVTFHVLDWPKVTTTAGLLALRMQQLEQRNILLLEARKKSFLSRAKAVDAYNQQHLSRMKRGEYLKGELVLVYNEALDNQMSGKGALRWHGPYAIVARHPSRAYVLQELDRAVLKQPVAWKRMKSYVPRRGLEPAVLAPKWLSPVDDIEEDLLKDDRDELKVMMAHVCATGIDLSWFPKPWLLKGKIVNEYWRRVYEHWMEREAKRRAGIHVEPEPEIPPEVEVMIEDDKQFWNYKDDITPDEQGELPRWKYSEPRIRELFEWLPWGKHGCFRQIQASSVELMEAISNEIQTLGEPQVEVLESKDDAAVSAALSSSQPARRAPECIIYADVDEEVLEGLSFSTSMAYAQRRPGGRGNLRGSRGFRGGQRPFDSRLRGRGYGAYPSRYPLVYKEEYHELEERIGDKMCTMRLPLHRVGNRLRLHQFIGVIMRIPIDISTDVLVLRLDVTETRHLHLRRLDLLSGKIGISIVTVPVRGPVNLLRLRVRIE